MYSVNAAEESAAFDLKKEYGMLLLCGFKYDNDGKVFRKSRVII